MPPKAVRSYAGPHYSPPQSSMQRRPPPACNDTCRRSRFQGMLPGKISGCFASAESARDLGHPGSVHVRKGKAQEIFLAGSKDAPGQDKEIMLLGQEPCGLQGIPPPER